MQNLSPILKKQFKKNKTDFFLNQFFQRFFANFDDNGMSIHDQVIESLLQSYFLVLQQKTTSFSRKSNSLKKKFSRSPARSPKSVELADKTEIIDFEPYKTVLNFLQDKKLKIEGNSIPEKAENFLGILKNSNVELNEDYPGFHPIIKTFLSQAFAYLGYQDYLTEAKQYNKAPLLLNLCQQVVEGLTKENASEFNFRKIFLDINALIDDIRTGHIENAEEIKPLEFILVEFRDQLIGFLKKYNVMFAELRNSYDLISAPGKVSVEAFWVLKNIVKQPETSNEEYTSMCLDLIDNIFQEVNLAFDDKSKTDNYFLFKTQIKNVRKSINELLELTNHEEFDEKLKYRIAKAAYQYNFYLQVGEISRVQYFDPEIYRDNLENIENELTEMAPVMQAQKVLETYQRQSVTYSNFNFIHQVRPFDLTQATYQVLNQVKYRMQCFPEQAKTKLSVKYRGLYDKTYAKMFKELFAIYQMAKMALDEKFEFYKGKLDEQKLQAFKIFEMDDDVAAFLTSDILYTFEQFDVIKEKVMDFLMNMASLPVLQHNFCQNYYTSEAEQDSKVSKRRQNFPSKQSELSEWDGHLRNGVVSMMGADSEEELVRKLFSLHEIYPSKEHPIVILAIGNGGSKDFLNYRRINGQPQKLKNNTYSVAVKNETSVGHILQLKKGSKKVCDFVVYNIETADNTPFVLSADTRTAMQSILTQDRPLAIHCASGVGRTGQAALMREGYRLMNLVKKQMPLLEQLSDDSHGVYAQLRQSKGIAELCEIFCFPLDELETDENPMRTKAKFAELVQSLCQVPAAFTKLCHYQPLSEQEALAVNKVFSATLGTLRSIRYTIQTKQQYMGAIKETVMYFAQYNLGFKATALKELDEHLTLNRALSRFAIPVPESVIHDFENKQTLPPQGALASGIFTPPSDNETPPAITPTINIEPSEQSFEFT